MLVRIFPRLILSLLFIACSVPVWAAIGLEQWGTEVIGTRLLAENDIAHPYAEALRLQTELPTPVDKEKASSRIVELDQRHETENTQCQIDELNRRNERQALEIRQSSLQQRWLWTVLGGSLLMLVGTGYFLARQRHVNRSLCAANSQLQRWYGIFEHAEWGIVIGSADGDTLELINPAFARMHGYTVDELTGRPIGEVFAPQSKDDFLARIGIAHQNGHHSFESWHLRKDGTVFPVFIDITTVRGPVGGVLHRIVNVQDITERKRAEEAILAREREFRTLAENIPDHIIRYDAQARKVYMNTATARLMGVETDALIGQTPEETPAETRTMNINAFSEKLRQVLASGEAQEFEVTLRHATDGMQIHNVKFVAERDEQGKIVGALVVGRDITAHKAAENELKESERRYREIFENVTDSLYLVEVTPEGRFRNLAFNFAFEQSMGIPREDLIGIDVGSAVDEETGTEENADSVAAKYRRCLKAGSNIEEETTLDLPSGRRHFHSTLVPLYDESGRVCRILGIASDITERKRAEQQIRSLNANLEQQVLDRTAELRQQTRYLRTLVDSLPLLVWLKDTESRFVMVNQATADSYRLSIEQMIGKSDIDLWPRETAEEYISEDMAVMQSRKRNVFEKMLTLKNHSVWTEIDKVPVLDDDGSVLGTVGVARNISERKALEIARENALAEAIRLANLRSEFMARMSHELRTPLNGILGYAQVLQRDKAIDPRRRGMLNVIQESGEHLLHLINDILDFAKIEAGKQTLTLSDVTLRRFLHNLTNIVTIRAEQKQLTFHCDIADTVPEVIRADEIRLRQVLLNLLSNAVKFTNRGLIELRVTLESEAQGAEIVSNDNALASTICRLRFQIRDSGIGIEAGQLESIFQPFEQAGDSRQGTGLGLAISRELVRLMGGEIRVDSRPGEGSIFWFDLDVDIVPGVGEGIGFERQNAIEAGKACVLVACAGEENRKWLVELLCRLGFETFSTTSGSECLESAQKCMPDLIVVNSGLQDMSDTEILRRLRRLTETARTPIIGVGAETSDHEIAEVMAGANIFLPMPIDSEILAATITDLLRQDKASPRAEAKPHGQAAFRQTMALPPPEEMQILYRFAREGSMRDIIRQAAHLTELDERYRPFADQLRKLASAYQSKAILEWVSSYVDNHSRVS
ncbi:MAG: PAS domain S-box protein [Methylococcaceae bacterium]|nr:PAS domain S-box protein [Methylococcaceae bacterium]